VDAFRREGEHTTHVSIVDALGGAVALTTTINSWYGSKVVVEGAGIVLNNDMDDFTGKPGTANQFGLVQGEANAVAAGKRMLSAMTPTIVLDPAGRLFLVLGTPGGSTIITTVFQVLSNLVDHRMGLGSAVLAPRVHHQHLPDQIAHEPGGLPEPVMEALRALGHTLKPRDELSGDVEAILVRPDGVREGISDPRRGGVALGF
jgi:gamma-glutamyltranspeptidase/glutathione hydrolase